MCARLGWVARSIRCRRSQTLRGQGAAASAVPSQAPPPRLLTLNYSPGHPARRPAHLLAGPLSPCRPAARDQRPAQLAGLCHGGGAAAGRGDPGGEEAQARGHALQGGWRAGGGRGWAGGWAGGTYFKVGRGEDGRGGWAGGWQGGQRVGREVGRVLGGGLGRGHALQGGWGWARQGVGRGVGGGLGGGRAGGRQGYGQRVGRR